MPLSDEPGGIEDAARALFAEQPLERATDTLDGRVVILTGADRGLGRAMSLALAG